MTRITKVRVIGGWFLNPRCCRTLRLLARQDLAFVNPALHSDNSVCRVRLRESVVDIRAQRVQRQPALQVPFGPRDFRPVQTAANANLDSFRPEPESRIHRLSHRAAESDSLLELQCDRLSDQLSVQFRTMDFL